jgi:AraC-like DNA-binding protein
VPSGRTIARFELQRFVRFVVAERPRVDARDLCAAAGEHDLLARDGESRTTIERTWDLWGAATEATGDRTLATRFGLATRLEDLGLYGFAILTAPTVREATSRGARFLGLVSDSGRVEVVERGSSAHLRFVRDGTRSLGHQTANETVLAQWVGATRQVVGAYGGASVAYRHAAPPADAKRIERILACPVRWSAAHDELVVPRALLDQPLRTRNDEMSSYFGAEVQRREAERAASDGLAGRVRHCVAAALVDGEPQIEAVARELGWSERTLRRRLAESDVSFRDLVQEVRRDRATMLLEDARLSLTEIAFALGFSEASAFTRAARRWFGASPRAHRRVLREAVASR